MHYLVYIQSSADLKDVNLSRVEHERLVTTLFIPRLLAVNEKYLAKERQAVNNHVNLRSDSRSFLESQNGISYGMKQSNWKIKGVMQTR